MEHIFVFDPDTRLYQPEGWTSPQAQAAVENGQFLYKVDGSNGIVVIRSKSEETVERFEATDSSSWRFEPYQRLDTKGKAPPESSLCIELPSTCQNLSIYEGHSYWYQPITIEGIEGKKARKRNQQMIDLVEKHQQHLLEQSGLWKTRDSEDEKTRFVSIEWVGTKFNRTGGVPHDIALALHSEQQLSKEDTSKVDRSYEGIRKFLLEADPPIEGLIIRQDMGTPEGVGCTRYWKVRSDCFDRKCRFKQSPGSARAPHYLTC